MIDRILAALVPVLLGVAFFAGSVALGATFTVTNLNDSSVGSLRQAVNNANTAAGADTITFQAGLAGTITLTTGELPLTGDVTISGPGSAVLAVSGNNASRVFVVASGATATITGLTLANGNSDRGGAVAVVGNLILNDCTVTGNTATFDGGGILMFDGGARLNRCTISNNTAAGNGGGIWIGQGTIPMLAMVNCTLSGNQAGGLGGGIRLSNNSPSIASLASCTIVNNTANGGGGGVSTNGDLFALKNTIVAGNHAPTGPDILYSAGTLGSLGHNLVSNNEGSALTAAPGDLIGTPAAPIDPMLGPLADGGGPTWTHAPLPGSPAIDAGDGQGAPATDQRGQSRPGGAGCGGSAIVDIGAYEISRYAVTNTSDSGPGSMRQAIADNNASPAGWGRICCTAGGVINLVSGQLTLSRSVTIEGPGSANLTLNGNGRGRVFQIPSGVTAAIADLAITNGREAEGGAIANAGTLTLTRCTVTNSVAKERNTGGGGILNDGKIVIDQCTVAGNQAVDPTISIGGGIYNRRSTSLVLTNSTVFGNSAQYGAGIANESADAQLINVTLSGNTTTGAGWGGALLALNNPHKVTLIHCTVVGNSATNGGGVGVFNASPELLYLNTLFSDNLPANLFTNGGPLKSLGHNLSSDGSGNLTATGDLPNTNPLLGPLADNGGPTRTHALLPGSPAIDAGDNNGAPAGDERGSPRIVDGNGDGTAVADIGAFEAQAVTPVTLVAAVSRRTHGTAGTFDIDVARSAAVEPRVGGPTRLLVTFNQPIRRVTGTLADVSLSSGAVSALTVAGPLLTIDLSHVTNAQALAVAFPGIKGSNGPATASRLCFGVLAGDVNEDARNSLSDMVGIRDRLNQRAQADNCRYDVNADGVLNLGDLIVVRDNMNATSPTTCP